MLAGPETTGPKIWVANQDVTYKATHLRESEELRVHTFRKSAAVQHPSTTSIPPVKTERRQAVGELCLTPRSRPLSTHLVWEAAPWSLLLERADTPRSVGGDRPGKGGDRGGGCLWSCYILSGYLLLFMVLHRGASPPYRLTQQSPSLRSTRLRPRPHLQFLFSLRSLIVSFLLQS